MEGITVDLSTCHNAEMTMNRGQMVCGVCGNPSDTVQGTASPESAGDTVMSDQNENGPLGNSEKDPNEVEQTGQDAAQGQDVQSEAQSDAGQNGGEGTGDQGGENSGEGQGE